MFRDFRLESSQSIVESFVNPSINRYNEKISNQLSQGKDSNTHHSSHTRASAAIQSSNSISFSQKEKTVGSVVPCHFIDHSYHKVGPMPNNSLSEKQEDENKHRNSQDAQLTTLNTPSGTMEILTIDAQKRSEIQSQTSMNNQLMSAIDFLPSSNKSKHSKQSQNINIPVAANEIGTASLPSDDLDLKSDICVEGESLALSRTNIVGDNIVTSEKDDGNTIKLTSSTTVNEKDEQHKFENLA